MYMGKINESIVANRRARLNAWIDQYCDGKQAVFIERTDINQGELSALLKQKSFGEKKARSLEEKAGMPKYWLDQTFDNTTGEEVIVRELPAVYANTQSLESRPPVITDEEWKLVSPKTRALVEEILIKSNNQTLQDDDIKLLQDMADKLSNR